MDRRDAIKWLSGIGTASVLGGAGLTFWTDRARATANQDLGTATVKSDDGSVEYIAIYGDSVVKWDGFDTEARYFKIKTFARVDGESGFKQLNDTGKVDLTNDNWGNYDEDTSDPGTSGYIETGIGLRKDGTHKPSVDWDIVGEDPDDDYDLPTDSLSTALVENTKDGTTQTFDLTVRSRYIWYDSAGSQIFEKDFDANFSVDVTNEPATATAEEDSGEDGVVGE